LPGETLKIDLRVSSSTNESDSDYANAYAVAPVNAFDSRARQHSETGNRIVDFSGDYERPLAGGTAKLGYKVADNKSSFDTLYTDINPASLRKPSTACAATVSRWTSAPSPCTAPTRCA
jgi:hypothetical protein